MMAFLGTDPSVTFGLRSYSFEERRLTYLAKFSVLADRAAAIPNFDDYIMRDIDESIFGPPPWYPIGTFLPPPETMDFFPHLWEVTCQRIAPSASIRYYAEKAPTWISPYVAPYVTPFNICLFRDPRDNFISAMDFMRKRGYMIGFGRDLDDPDEKFVRTTCFRWINFFENWFMTRTDPRTLLVRYEDFVADPGALAQTLKDRLDLNVDPCELQEIAHHRTAPTHQKSVARHRSANLPQELQDIFIETLAEEMSFLNYSPSRQPRFRKTYFKDLPVMPAMEDGVMHAAVDRAIVEITGPDFHFYPALDSFEAAEIHSLWISACAKLGNNCSVYWRRQGEFFSEERVIHVSYYPGRHWRVFRFDFAGHPRWAGEIVELRLDLFNFAQIVTPGSAEVSWFRFIANTRTSS
jgi:hypothetical protein